MSDIISGSCLCRAVSYTIDGPLKTVANCHCKTCKKITGGVFETVAVVRENKLHFSTGRESLTAYRISEHAVKYFCPVCGTPLYNSLKKFPGHCMVQVGTLDDPSLAVPAINIFCESMLPWVRGIGELQCFEREPTQA